METEQMFEYACPECGRGTVQTRRILNYKTKIKGYPFVVDEALIGECDQCGARSFAPQETKRWEGLFANSLEAHQAFLSPQEIKELRKSLGLSMEDFARLIGATRQSISMWEKEDRPSPPLRTADLLMKIVQKSLSGESVDILPFLLEEARKWGIVIQVHRPMSPKENGNLTLIAKKKSRRNMSQDDSSLSFVEKLAAETDGEEDERIIAETLDGKSVGSLDYDYGRATLLLNSINRERLIWNVVDVEIKTKDNQQHNSEAMRIQENQLVLLEKTKLQAEDIAQLNLKPHL